jgi:hypothetical protein
MVHFLTVYGVNNFLIIGISLRPATMFEFASDSSQNTRVTLLAQLLQQLRIIHLIVRCISPLFEQCYVEERLFET